MSKHFLVNPTKEEISREIHLEKEAKRKEQWDGLTELQDKKNSELLYTKEDLRFIPGRVIVKVDTEMKNWHQFEGGQRIRLERKFNEFNRRITEPTNAVVISSEYIPEGSEILIGHNALHDVNRIFNYKRLSGVLESADVRYYSIPEDECFAWKDKDGELKPMKNYAFALRVFKPYTGVLTGIEPSLIKEVLYITTGELSGNVCHVLKASDYTIIYQGADGREKQVIRCRHFEDDYNDKEEIITISHDLTDKVNSGELFVGIEIKDAKPIQINAYAD